MRSLRERNFLLNLVQNKPQPKKGKNYCILPDLDDADQVQAEKKSLALFITQLVGQTNALLERFHIPYTLDASQVYADITNSLGQMATPLAVGGFRIIISTLISLAIMVVTTYYFFADGPAMVTGLMRLSPLDDKYEQELLDKFSDISRSVVLATLASAIVQGLLAGIGFFFVGSDRIFFLTGLTMFLAMIPFVGAAAVWVPVCAWLHFHDHRTTAAVVLAIYCAGVVSMVDNIIKPYILHGQANSAPAAGPLKCDRRCAGSWPHRYSRRAHARGIFASVVEYAQQGTWRNGGPTCRCDAGSTHARENDSKRQGLAT